MKKFLTLLTIALSLVIINHSCKPDSEDELLQESGSIYGVVTDFATGEPVKNANVQLRPSGETTLTGSDGRYEFLDLPNGNYSITVSKAEYTDLIDDFVITVNGSKAMRRDVQIEKLPAALKVVDDNGNDINELDFGNSPDDVSRMFNIFNNGSNLLNYQVVKTSDWIVSATPSQGTLQPGVTVPIVVVIDREKMTVGENKTSIQITSNEGSRQMTIKAEKNCDISTLDASDITYNSAVLRANINVNASYTERGFYVGVDPNDMSKIRVNGNGTGIYTYNYIDIEEGRKYYYKAYLIKNSEVIFGETKYFTTEASFFVAEKCGPGGCDLFVDFEDMGSYRWIASGYSSSNIVQSNFSETDGMVNMNELRRLSPDLSAYPAAQACSMRGDGWYLPSKGELQKIITKYPDTFVADEWWTSSYRSYADGYNTYNFYTISPDGYEWHDFIHESHYVRAVKRAN